MFEVNYLFGNLTSSCKNYRPSKWTYAKNATWQTDITVSPICPMLVNMVSNVDRVSLL